MCAMTIHRLATFTRNKNENSLVHISFCLRGRTGQAALMSSNAHPPSNELFSEITIRIKFQTFSLAKLDRDFFAASRRADNDKKNIHVLLPHTVAHQPQHGLAYFKASTSAIFHDSEAAAIFARTVVLTFPRCCVAVVRLSVKLRGAGTDSTVQWAARFETRLLGEGPSSPQRASAGSGTVEGAQVGSDVEVQCQSIQIAVRPIRGVGHTELTLNRKGHTENEKGCNTGLLLVSPAPSQLGT